MADTRLTIKRQLKAPRQKVWQAWTGVHQLQQWWGPRGVTNPHCVWQAKAGGAIDITMRAGPTLGPLAGTEWPMKGQFLEVSPPEKLVFTSQALANGQPILETRCTLTLQDRGGQTELTLDIVVTKASPEAADALAGMETGWNQSLDKLTESVE